MKMQLLGVLSGLNDALEKILSCLRKLEKSSLFDKELIRFVRANILTARVEINRECFENIEAILERDARWASRFQRECQRKMRDPEAVYLEIKVSEKRRMRKGLPPRVKILPNWDLTDEVRYDERQTGKERRVRSCMRRKAR